MLSSSDPCWLMHILCLMKFLALREVECIRQWTKELLEDDQFCHLEPDQQSTSHRSGPQELHLGLSLAEW